MEGISDIRIIGIDEKRPPRIRKEPYIDIYFKLSHQAPSDWCKDFNALLSKFPSSPRIKEKEGLFIDSWVKTPDDIALLLEKLNTKVAECSVQYIKRIEMAVRNSSMDNDALSEETGEQGRLKRLVASLIFEHGDLKELEADNGK